MPANTAPIFALTPNNGVAGVLLSTAMTNTKALDGTEAAGTAMALIFTAGANGARVDRINVRLSSTAGATASGTSSATVVRFWVNNGTANTTASNNILLPDELLIPATAVAALATSILSGYKIDGINIPDLKAGFQIYAGTTVAVGGTNIALAVNAYGGDY